MTSSPDQAHAEAQRIIAIMRGTGLFLHHRHHRKHCWWLSDATFVASEVATIVTADPQVRAISAPWGVTIGNVFQTFTVDK
jgi:hypothetical protein